MMVNMQNFSAPKGEDQLDFEWCILLIGYQRYKKRAVGARKFQADRYENSLVFVKTEFRGCNSTILTGIYVLKPFFSNGMK